MLSYNSEVTTHALGVLSSYEENNKYELCLNRKDFNDKQFWECFLKFILSLLCRNAVTRTSIEKMIETRQHGEKLMDRVSVLLRSIDAFNNILGKTYKYRLLKFRI